MSKIAGRWKIVSMDEWDQDYVDLVEPGYFKFDSDNLGEFVFGTVHGTIDVRLSSTKPSLEYSWEGSSEGDPCSGRGWFEFSTPNQGAGMIYIHCGDDSGISIEKET